MTMARALIEPLTPGEHLSPDDQATRREAEFLAQALVLQQARAAGMVVERGVCTSCGARCLPRAVYCDAECRADHEQRLARLARQRRSMG